MIKIEQANADHLENLVPLFDAYRVWYRQPSDLSTAKQYLKDRIAQKESIIYLAFDGDQAVGFTQLYPLFSSTRMKRLWLLNDLYVDETYRGKGISKQLINAAKDLARHTDAAGVLLETEQSNIIGNRLYPAMDFELEENNFYFWTKTAIR
ncbi:MAG: GNAT superfamily N-acetyltransferase [Saprospiraceae bacterium]|jgi:GNAT superfamily N-acetyltransferase